MLPEITLPGCADVLYMVIIFHDLDELMLYIDLFCCCGRLEEQTDIAVEIE